MEVENGGKSHSLMEQMSTDSRHVPELFANLSFGAEVTVEKWLKC